MMATALLYREVDLCIHGLWHRSRMDNTWYCKAGFSPSSSYLGRISLHQRQKKACAREDKAVPRRNAKVLVVLGGTEQYLISLAALAVSR